MHSGQFPAGVVLVALLACAANPKDNKNNTTIYFLTGISLLRISFCQEFPTPVVGLTYLSSSICSVLLLLTHVASVKWQGKTALT
jgi:hypothetical protein